MASTKKGHAKKTIGKLTKQLSAIADPTGDGEMFTSEAPPPWPERTYRVVMAEQATVVGVQLKNLALELRADVDSKRQNTIIRIVEATLAAFHGWSDVTRVKRMLVLEAIIQAAEQRRLEPDTNRAVNAWIQRSNRSHKQVAKLIVPVGDIVRMTLSGLVNPLPEDDIVEAAVAATLRGGRQRLDAKTPVKWNAYARIVEAVGLGKVKPNSLRVDFSRWSKHTKKEVQ